MLVTCVGSMCMAAGGLPAPGLLVWTALGLAMSTGGASALNHVLDRDIDRLMDRTRSRPIATGAISPAIGALFGGGLLLVAGLVLLVLVGPLAAVLAEFGGWFYVLVYTKWLKRTSVHNTVVGGICGAVPPLVGWAAVTGNLGAVLPWALFTIMFAWQPAHFWALSLLIRDDYAKAGIPMLPVVAGEQATVRATVRWAWFALATSLVPVLSGDAGVWYLIAALALDVWFMWRVLQLSLAARALRPGEPLIGPDTAGRAAARAAFLTSLSWLALLFVALLLDVTLG